MTDQRSYQSGWVWVTLAIAVMLTTTGTAWADHASSGGEEVAQSVAFLDTDVSGMALDQVRELVEDRASEVLTTNVIVDVGDRDVTFEAAELGFTYDVEGVVTDIMETRHEGSLEMRLIDWLTSPTHTITRGDRVDFDPDSAAERLEGEPALVLAEPTEPTITLAGQAGFHVVGGEQGGVVDVADLIDQLAAERPTSGPIHVPATRSGLSPTISDEQAREVADYLNETTEDGVNIAVGSAHVSIGSSLLRRYVEIDRANGAFTVDFDADGFHTLLEGLISEPVTELTSPEFTVEDGEPVVVTPGRPPLACCDVGSVRRAGDLIMAGATETIRVAPRPVDDARLISWATGEPVVEKVSEFTTNHACCQSRVQNIQRFADIVRGAYIVPGEKISLNEYVGQRTRAKGFVPAGAIRSGHLGQEVGGGVSQFATTIFNAAFFAGLDIPVYQAHSLYFSRYPFGREATISHPAPDLVLHNTTDHPVLIWTSYTDTSITVSMYSTKHVEVDQIDQRVGGWRQCTYVETDRQRNYPDGRQVVDTFEATYRPADGIDCNGNVIPQT